MISRRDYKAKVELARYNKRINSEDMTRETQEKKYIKERYGTAREVTR